jgi:hypothetical protein
MPEFSIDHKALSCEDYSMSTQSFPHSIPEQDAVADEEAVMASFAAGTPVDPEVARRVHERAMKLRDEIHRRHGVVDIGTPAIRELRGEFADA